MQESALLLVNAGPAPRAGNSDLSTLIADHAARSGVRAIRIDLPGVGDSTGHSHARIEDFRAAAHGGAFDEVLASVVEQAGVRHGVRRFAIGGLCAGSVVALRTARQLESVCAGLVLLEPDMLSVHPARNVWKAGVRATVDRGIRSLLRRRWSAAAARFLQRVQARVERGQMPAGIARDVVAAWVELSARGVPTFLAVAEGLACDDLCTRVATAARFGAVRTPDDASAAPSAAVTRLALRESNHLLTAGDAPTRIPPAVAAWLRVLG